MNEQLPISVHVLTWNSGKTLRKALESVKHCAEILVIDGGSTDNTLQIAQEFGAIIIPQRAPDQQGQPLEHYADARNKGLAHSTQPWILAQDSDEYASPQMMNELRAVTESYTSPAAYYVPRKYVMDDGTVIEYASTYPNERIYFFHKDAVKQWIKPVHERPEIKPNIPIRHLKGASLAPLGTMEDYKRKNERYIQIEKQKSKDMTFSEWFKRRLLHTLRSRLIALLRILWIWLIPRRGKKLPLKQELLRFWYGWKLIKETYPRKQS